MRWQWGPSLRVVGWGAVRRSFQREREEAPTSCPVSSGGRRLAAEVAGVTAVEEGDPGAAEGGPWPESRSWHAPVQLQQLHGPGPAAASLGSAGRPGSRGGSTCSR